MPAAKARRFPKRAGRTDVITVRLDPQLRYAAELAASQTQNTLSGFIEHSISRMVKETMVVPATSNRPPRSAADVAVEVWEPDGVNRLIRLVTRHPRLMTLTERRVWRLIEERPGLWKVSGSHDPKDVNDDAVRAGWEELLYEAETGFPPNHPALDGR